MISGGGIAAELDALVSARYSLTDVGQAFQRATSAFAYRVLVGDR